MRCLVVASFVAISAMGCSNSDNSPAFDEAAVVAYLKSLDVNASDARLDGALLADARNICTGELDANMVALIKVSVGQGTDAILRAGCPGRVDDVMANR